MPEGVAGSLFFQLAMPVRTGLQEGGTTSGLVAIHLAAAAPLRIINDRLKEVVYIFF
jgi:hypothetical protein